MKGNIEKGIKTLISLSLNNMQSIHFLDESHIKEIEEFVPNIRLSHQKNSEDQKQFRVNGQNLPF